MMPKTHANGDATAAEGQMSARNVIMSIEWEFVENAGMVGRERLIQDAFNQPDCELTECCMQAFETDGSIMEIGAVKFTSKGSTPRLCGDTHAH
jgi:hypothetical protein